MDKAHVQQTLEQLRSNSPKRKFNQSVDLVINLKGLDPKNPDHQINQFVTLHNQTGRKVSVCALVGAELATKAKEVCDEVITVDEFDKFKAKNDIKKLADRHSFFIAQATIMPKIAQTFGRFFGPRGKMPNPKVGAVLPPNANVAPLYEKLSHTVQVQTKNEMTVKCIIGKQDMSDEILIDNIMTVYNAVMHAVPNEIQNIDSVLLKYTMGPAVKVGGVDEEETEGKPAEKPKAAPEEKKEAPVQEESQAEVKEEAATEEKPDDKPAESESQ